MQFILYPLASVLFYALMAFVPQIGLVTAVFSPMLLLLYFDLGKRNRFSDLYLAGLIAVLAGIGPVLAGFYLISVLAPALFIHRYLKSGRLEPWIPAAVTPLLTLASVFIAVYFFSSYRNEMTDVAEKALITFLDAVKASKSPVAGEDYFLKVSSMTREAALSIVLIFPAVNYVFTAFSAHIALNLYAKMRRIQLPKFRLPDNLVWLLIAGFALIFIKQDMTRHIGLNLIIIMMTLYAFQGFDIMTHWMIKLRIFPIIRAIIFVFIFSEPPAIILIALLGLFSVWFNLYGRQQPPEEQKPLD